MIRLKEDVIPEELEIYGFEADHHRGERLAYRYHLFQENNGQHNFEEVVVYIDQWNDAWGNVIYSAREVGIITHAFKADKAMNTGEFSTAAYGFVSHEEARKYLIEQSGVDIGQSLEAERSEEDYITQARNEIAEFDAGSQATDGNQRFYYPINEEAARRAKEANSYSDYKEGSATAEYRRSIDRAIEIATKQKALVDPMYHERIDALLNTYAKRLADNTNEGNVIDARMPSYLITGGGNFNVGKKQKQNAARDRNHQEWQEIQSILDRIRSTGKGGISSDDPNSIQKLTAKLEGLEKSQETMKAVNAYYRKNKTLDGCPELTAEQIAELKADMKRFPHLEGKPYPTWALSNNNAEIRRVKERIEELSKRQEGSFVGWEFNGGEVRANTADNRLQIFFEEKPDEETRSDLKHNGFKWSPKANAWQRQLTANAYYAADRINAIQPLNGEKPTALQRAYVRQHNADVASNEEKTNSAVHYSINFTLNYSNNMLLGNELRKLGFEEDKTLWEENSRIDEINTQNGNGVWLNRIRYTAPNGKVLEGFFGRTFNGIMLEATNVSGFTSTGLTAEEAQAIAEIIKDFGVDVEVREVPIQINVGANEQAEKHKEKDDTPPNMPQLTKNLPNLEDREEYEFKALKILLESSQKGEPVGGYITFADYNYLFRTNDVALKYGGEVENGSVIITEALINSYNKLREKYDRESPIHLMRNEGEEHEEKMTLEQARNAMLDAQEQRQNHYAVCTEFVPYTDPMDGYESEKAAQVIYMISEHGFIETLKTITVDDDAFYYLPYTDFLNYERVEYEELEEIAKKVREPIQAYKDVLRAELEADTERRRSEAYYDQRVDDILDEHYRTEYGLFKSCYF